MNLRLCVACPEIWHEGIGGYKAFWRCVAGLQEANQLSVLGMLSFGATFRLYLERARWCHPAGELKNKLILRSERHGSSTTIPLSLLLFCGTKTFWSHLKKELHHSHPWQSVKWTATVALRGHSCTEKRCKGNPPSPPFLEKSKHNTYMLFISQLHFTWAWMQLRYRPCITRTIS